MEERYDMGTHEFYRYTMPSEYKVQAIAGKVIFGIGAISVLVAANLNTVPFAVVSVAAMILGGGLLGYATSEMAEYRARALKKHKKEKLGKSRKELEFLEFKESLTKLEPNSRPEPEPEPEPVRTWQDYEIEVRDEFIKHGMRARTTNGAADGGIDVIVEHNGLTIGVQVKDWQNKVGIKVVGEVLMGIGSYNCDYGCVIARNGYTQPCHSSAIDNKIALLDMEDISVYVEKIKKGIT